jgi:hypothetical protein
LTQTLKFFVLVFFLLKLNYVFADVLVERVLYDIPQNTSQGFEALESITLFNTLAEGLPRLTIKTKSYEYVVNGIDVKNLGLTMKQFMDLIEQKQSKDSSFDLNLKIILYSTNVNYDNRLEIVLQKKQ